MASRRDEVWERKRQAFLSRQNGDGASAISRPSMASGARSQARPNPLTGHEERRAPSPLSRLVKEGYPETVGSAPQGTPTTRQMYGMQAYAGQAGSRPGSRQREREQQQQQQEGFHGGVAQQWSNNVQRSIEVHQQRNDPNFTGPKKPQGYRVSQAPGGATSINLSWNEAAGPPQRAPSPGGRALRGEAMVPAGRAPSPGARQHFQGEAMPSPSAALGQAAGLAAPPGARHPCYGDPMQAGSACYGNPAQAGPGFAVPPQARQPHYGEAQGMAAAGLAAPPQARHPCYGDMQAIPQVQSPAALQAGHRAPSPGNRRLREVPPSGNMLPAGHAMPAAGFQANPAANRGGGAPFANDYAPGGGLPPPMPRQSVPYAQDGVGAAIHGRYAEHQNMSANAYACGGNQNCGNVMTNRRTTKVSQPPGGGSSISFG
mmetsp:Transcript_54674/g.127497  ORF Transcript_54674/g.127497 Transcript_54674/m.127497 type:complete len:430 (+) Transcript_54674:81-1370(+)